MAISLLLKKKVRATLFDISYETLFIGKPNETNEEREQRLKYLEEFKKNYYSLAHESVFESTGFQLNNLSFKEQGWFLIYFNKSSEQERKRLTNFVSNFGEEGIKAFLSLEQGEESAENILHIAESIDHESALAVYLKFNEVASFIKKTDQELSATYLHDNKHISPASEIIKRAEKILTQYSSSIRYPDSPKNESQSETRQILKDLDHIRTDLIIFSAVFKSCFDNNNNLSFDDVIDLDFMSIISNKIDETTQKEIIDLAEETYKDNPIVFQEVKEEIQATFAKDKKSQWYLLKQSGDLAACIRFDQIDNNTVYAGSFMVNPLLTGSAIGKVMEQKTMDVMAQTYTIQAVVEMRREIASHYLEKKNFIIKGITQDDKSGIHLFNIERDDQINNLYKKNIDSLHSIQAQEAYEKDKFDVLKKIPSFCITVPVNKDNRQLNSADINKFSTLLTNQNSDSYVITSVSYKNENGVLFGLYNFERKINYLESQDYLKSKAA